MSLIWTVSSSSGKDPEFRAKFDCILLRLINSDNNYVSFVYRKADVGQFKADIAAKFVMKRCPGVKITHHTDPIQKFDERFYKQFHIFIAGLDNIEARRWLNSMIHSIVQFDADGDADPAT